MFIGRRQDGTIYGAWSTRQADDDDHQRQEEVPDDHPELVAFLAPVVPTQAAKEKWARDAFDGVIGNGAFDVIKLFKAKAVSDLAFRLGKAPGALTAQELAAERDRIAAIYKAL